MCTHGIRGFGAAHEPFLDFIRVKLHFRRIGHGIVVAQQLQRTPVTTGLVIGGHHPVEGVLFTLPRRVNFNFTAMSPTPFVFMLKVVSVKGQEGTIRPLVSARIA